MVFIIIAEECSSCGLCADLCPAEAINPVGVYKINADLCTGCGECAQCCPVQAIRPLEENS